MKWEIGDRGIWDGVPDFREGHVRDPGEVVVTSVNLDGSPNRVVRVDGRGTFTVDDVPLRRAPAAGITLTGEAEAAYCEFVRASVELTSLTDAIRASQARYQAACSNMSRHAVAEGRPAKPT